MKKLICLIMATILCLLTGCAEHEVVTTQDDFLSFADISLVELDETSEITSSEAPVETSQTNAQTTSQTDSPEITVSPDNTTANDTSSASEIPAPDTVENIRNASFLRYRRIKSAFKPASSKKHAYLYNFNTSLSTGFGEEDIDLPTEAFYGMKGNVDGKLLTVSVYDHTDGKLIDAVLLESMDVCDDNRDYKILVLIDNRLTLDTTNLHNGLYRILVDYENDTAKLYFYVNGNETWLCQIEILKDTLAERYVERRNALIDVINNGNVTPQNSLSLENVWYPCYEFDESYRCDTQRWIDLSNELVEDSWSDEYKLFTFASWLKDNIAYDYFVKDSTSSRAQLYKDYSGKYSVYNLRAGVCFDYANLLAIMCRAHNIPSITIGSSEMNHVWNAVYINNRWIEMDVTTSAKYYVNEDTTNRQSTNDDPYDGLYKFSPWGKSESQTYMPSDALANQFFQQNSYYIY